MKTDLSPAAEKAILFARTNSVVDELDLNRLMLALIADDESLPAERLTAAGCRLEDLRQALDQLTPMTIYQRKFLHLARETATDRLESTITGEYLLLTLLTHQPELKTIVERSGGKINHLLDHQVTEVIRTEEPAVISPPSDMSSVRRMCDVNGNRIRESLRILDDYARFSRNDPRITESVKNLRHDFVSILRDHPALAVLESRDTIGDVGTVISTPGEQRRMDANDVALVNIKRLQESLRSLEEFGKIIDPMASVKIEQLRYRSYTLERDLFVESPLRKRLKDAKLYLLVSSESCPNGLEATVRGAIAGGVSVVQLREKNVDDRTLFQTAERIRQWTRETDTLFILNDRPDVARLVEADGVHLGQEDLPITAVRKILPPDMLIGVSTHNPGQLAGAMAMRADYVGVGPTFPSSTKRFEEFAGLEYVRHAAEKSLVPMFAIGGVNLDNIGQAVDAGASGVAVSAVITRASNPEATARQLLNALNLATSK
ncbi:thiamine phosphate synthase [Zavarzinella formosa]|uniref:thiamine phosphate synthase n=1 Tax=Zavarzinella formosa TaxID=360055 RepID=UPI00030C8709|nr:thiamine phosphate synthase [Zavarzinella formosa]